MKVIFIKDLRGQGKRGDIKEVKDGYAKNFLIKNGYASQLTDSSLGKYNRECEQQKEQDDKNRKEAKSLKEAIEKVELVFTVKTGKGDQVFGSISSKQIKEELDKKGYSFDKKQIKMENINCFGFHNVDIILYKDIVATVRVEIKKR